MLTALIVAAWSLYVMRKCKTKKVLLVDTNFSSFPIYQSLVGLGYQVYVIGKDARDFLARFSPHYIEADYSNPETLESVLADLCIDVVIPGCNDLSYKMCSMLMSEKQPGLDAPNVTAALFNKEAFRDLCEQLGLPSPRRIKMTGTENPPSVPIVVKPTDSYSGKGISVLMRPESVQIREAFDFAERQSMCGRAIMEEFVEGQLYSHSAFIRNGEVVADFIVREYCSVNPLVVDVSYVDRTFPADLLVELRAAVSLLACELGLSAGLMHVQFIRNDNDIWLIEVTRRCPGDLYSTLIQRSTGIPYSMAYLSPFVDIPDSLYQCPDAQRHLLRHTITQKSTCVFRSLKFELDRPFEYVPVAITGDILEPSPAGRVGIMFVEAIDSKGLDSLLEDSLGKKLYSLETVKISST